MKILNIEPLSFKGRITRKTFWLANGLLYLFSLVAYIIIAIILGLLPDNPTNAILSGINIFVVIATLLALVALVIIYTLIGASLVIRRAHDRDSSGWLWLFGSALLFVPWVVLGLLPGHAASNKFGSARH